MKRNLLPFFTGAFLALALSACSPVTLTSWIDPKLEPDFKVKTLVVWGMFDQMDIEKPFEEAVATYLQGKGIRVIPALKLLEPRKKYEYAELEEIFGKAGANSALIFVYEGTDKSENYVPGTTTVYPGFYHNYYNYYNHAWPRYWGGGAVVSTPGYWTTTTTIKLVANLYANTSDKLAYSAALEITDPQDIQSAGYDIAKKIYADWVRLQAVSKD